MEEDNGLVGMIHEYTYNKPLVNWIVEHEDWLENEYGLCLADDKYQWIIGLLDIAYELGVAHENELMWRREQNRPMYDD